MKNKKEIESAIIKNLMIILGCGMVLTGYIVSAVLAILAITSGNYIITLILVFIATKLMYSGLEAFNIVHSKKNL